MQPLVESKNGERKSHSLHGDETDVWGDAGYRGIEKRMPAGSDPPHWHISMMHSKRRQLGDSPADRALVEGERRKSRIRAKVEHQFRIAKRQFKFQRFRYRGLAKNTAHVMLVFTLVNVYRHRAVLALA